MAEHADDTADDTDADTDIDIDIDTVRRAYGAAAGDYARIQDDELADDPGVVDIVRTALGGLRAASRVVDVGCGPAQLTPLLVDLGLVPVGLDLTGAMLHQARVRHPHLRLVQADLLHLPLAAGSCPGVVARFALHNLPRARLPAALGELRRIVADDGVVLVATHRGQGVRPSAYLRRHAGETVPTAYYRADELTELLHGAGLAVHEVVEREPADGATTGALYVTARPARPARPGHQP
ncbi:MAG TPA: class I SAM-dependent methyltransferase [Acidimicrobiales bacterium]|nr:class I SAM-dependent methyltransferase [Acidimicrobiales bacterium]